MKTVILLFFTASCAISAAERDTGVFGPRRRELTPVDQLKAEIAAIPLCLERAQEVLKRNVRVLPKADAQQGYEDLLRTIYKGVMQAEMNAYDYVTTKKPALGEADRRLFRKIEQRKATRWYRDNALENVHAKDLVAKLQDEHQDLESTLKSADQ